MPITSDDSLLHNLTIILSLVSGNGFREVQLYEKILHEPLFKHFQLAILEVHFVCQVEISLTHIASFFINLKVIDPDFRLARDESIVSSSKPQTISSAFLLRRNVSHVKLFVVAHTLWTQIHPCAVLQQPEL